MGKFISDNTFATDIIPPDDEQRVNALREYCLLDAPPDEYFQNIVHLAAAHFDVPIALVSLVDSDDVYFKGNAGMKGVEKVRRGISLCSLAVLSSAPTIITKPLEDPCLIGNPLVHKEFGLRFYAAAPLITSQGYRIGAVCIVDKKERSFSADAEAQLVRFAQLVMHDMELRLSVLKRARELESEVKNRQKLITSAVLAAQERERSRMGIELHDNVNQILTTVKLYTEMALDPNVNTSVILTKSKNYLQECIDEIRLISRQLSATTIGEISLADSLKELVSSMNKEGKVEIDLTTKLHDTMPVSQELHTSIYRIVQEGLNNIIRHAQASSAVVLLAGTADGLRLELNDNGIGFDMKAKATGIGITNIKARVDHHGGNINIMTARGQGCCMKVYLPYYSKN